MSRHTLGVLVLLIAGVTVLSGFVQLVCPGFVLSFVQGEATPTSAHFFRIIGMFMVLFGGLLLQSYRLEPSSSRIPLFWCMLQKLGAAGAVGWAVAAHLLSPLSLAIAAFDFVSAVLIHLYGRAGTQ